MSNSFKYNTDNGSVKLSTSLKNHGHKIRISISDTGKGIDAENIPKLFTPFERVGAEKTNIEGTGLGLAVVKKLVDANDGEINVESTVGVGTEFWIEFNCKKSDENSKINSKKLSKNFKSDAQKVGVVLCIDDNDTNIELIEHIFESEAEHIRLLIHKNGNSGLQTAFDVKPDLILLDLNLPDLQGKEVLKALKLKSETKNIPVVIVSADAMPEQIDDLIRLGANQYITKPFDIETFIQIVKNYLK